MKSADNVLFLYFTSLMGLSIAFCKYLIYIIQSKFLWYWHTKNLRRFLRFKPTVEMARFLLLQWCFNLQELEKFSWCWNDLKSRRYQNLRAHSGTSAETNMSGGFCLVNPNILSIKVFSSRSIYFELEDMYKIIVLGSVISTACKEKVYILNKIHLHIST